MASMLALVETKATPMGGDAVVVPRIGWAAGLPNGVAGRNLAFAGLQENQRADVALLSAFARESGDLLYVTEDHQFDFVAAFDPVRGAGPVTDPLVAAGGGAWTLRASSVVFETLPIWVGFGRRWANIRQVDAAIDAARQRIANRPTLILSAAIQIAKRYGVVEQLDTALARALTLCFGPYLPTDHNKDEVVVNYVASTCFFEVGDVAAPFPALPPIALTPASATSAAPGGTARRRGDSTNLEETVSACSRLLEQIRDLQYVADLVNRVGTDANYVLSAFQTVASTTWSVYGIVARTLGLDWNTFREWFGTTTTLQSHLVERFLQSEEGGTSSMNRIVNVALIELFNISWPRASPQAPSGWSRNLGEVVRCLGTQDATNFGNVAHALGWLDWTINVPDVLPYSRRQATGNLAATFVVTQPNQERREFRMIDLYTRQDLITLLVLNTTEYLPDFVNEVNLFVRVLSYAAIQAVCEFIRARYEAWDQLDDVRLQIAAAALGPWNWLVDGQSIIEHFQRVQTNPLNDELDVTPEPKPDWLEWEWMAQENAINPNTAVYRQTQAGRPMLWIPRLVLTGMPSSVLARMQLWLQKNGSVDVMARTRWFEYQAADTVNTLVSISQATPRYGGYRPNDQSGLLKPPPPRPPTMRGRNRQLLTMAQSSEESCFCSKYSE